MERQDLKIFYLFVLRQLEQGRESEGVGEAGSLPSRVLTLGLQDHDLNQRQYLLSPPGAPRGRIFFFNLEKFLFYLNSINIVSEVEFSD